MKYQRLILILLITLFGAACIQQSTNNDPQNAPVVQTQPTETALTAVPTILATSTTEQAEVDIDINPHDLLQTAEDNLHHLDSYSVMSLFEVSFGDFPPDRDFAESCEVDRLNTAIYCLGRHDLVRRNDIFWRSLQGSPWAEPTESTLRRMDVIIRYFEVFGISTGVIHFQDEGFPTLQISQVVHELEVQQETTFAGHDVYEITFSVDDNYHDILNYRGGLATQTMGTMREAASELEGSGSGTVLIDKNLHLIRSLTISTTAKVDQFDAETILYITFDNFNQPMEIPDPEVE